MDKGGGEVRQEVERAEKDLATRDFREENGKDDRREEAESQRQEDVF